MLAVVAALLRAPIARGVGICELTLGRLEQRQTC